jgi:hypothetical protein
VKEKGQVIKRNIRDFLLGLACKKKCIVRNRRRRISMFGAKLKKNPGAFHPNKKGMKRPKNSSHATVPLTTTSPFTHPTLFSLVS